MWCCMRTSGEEKYVRMVQGIHGDSDTVVKCAAAGLHQHLL